MRRLGRATASKKVGARVTRSPKSVPPPSRLLGTLFPLRPPPFPFRLSVLPATPTSGDDRYAARPRLLLNDSAQPPALLYHLVVKYTTTPTPTFRPYSARVLSYTRCLSGAMSSPEPSLSDESTARFDAHSPSKAYLDWHQEHFVTIPLLLALHDASNQLECDAASYRDSLRLSPTPSLLSDSSSRSSSPPRSPAPTSARRRSKLNRRRSPSHQQDYRITHRTNTRSGTRRDAGRAVFWELDCSGRVAKCVPR